MESRIYKNYRGVEYCIYEDYVNCFNGYEWKHLPIILLTDRRAIHDYLELSDEVVINDLLKDLESYKSFPIKL